MGSHMVDCGLFQLGGVEHELQRIKDWAADLLPMHSASSDTVHMIASLAATEDIGTVTVMCVCLYFTHLKLFGVNSKRCGSREIIVFLWCHLI